MADEVQRPAMPAPEDLPNDKNLGDGLCIMTWVLLAFATVLVGARIMSKTMVLRRFRLDDVFLIVTWACAVVYSACIQLSYHNGLGRHSVFLATPSALELLKWAYACQMFCILTPMFGRITVILYTLNLLGKSKRYLRYSLWALLFLQTVFNVAIACTLLAACGVDMIVVANPTSTCYRESPWSRFAQFVGAFNAFTDGALTLAPVFLIWGLRTTTKAKLAASVLLGFSSLAMVAAIWRTLELDKIFAADWDFTFNAIPYFYASSFEQSTIMIAAAIPTLGPLIKHIRTKSTSKFSSGNRSSTMGLSGNDTSSRHLSQDSIQIQKTLAHALGIHMPGLGNTVTITAGKEHLSSKDSRDSVMPLSKIKTTTKTDVKVESVPCYAFNNGEEDVERLFSMPTTVSRDGGK